MPADMQLRHDHLASATHLSSGRVVHAAAHVYTRVDTQGVTLGDARADARTHGYTFYKCRGRGPGHVTDMSTDTITDSVTCRLQLGYPFDDDTPYANCLSEPDCCPTDSWPITYSHPTHALTHSHHPSPPVLRRSNNLQTPSRKPALVYLH